MDNNDILRRLRYALNITDIKVIELFALAGRQIDRAQLEPIFKREDEAGYAECSDELARLFLEGLIVSRRGRREDTRREDTRREDTLREDTPRREDTRREDTPHKAPPRKGPRLTNNEVLKALRIALELKDEDILAILALAGTEVSKAELSALFRKPGHENYRPCGDQLLRNFLVGLTARLRV